MLLDPLHGIILNERNGDRRFNVAAKRSSLRNYSTQADRIFEAIINFTCFPCPHVRKEDLVDDVQPLSAAVVLLWTSILKHLTHDFYQVTCFRSSGTLPWHFIAIT